LLIDSSIFQVQFLPGLDDLDYKSIAPSLREFSFSGNNFSFDDDHNSLYRDDTFAPTQEDVDDDGDGDTDPVGYTQGDTGGQAPFDDGDVQEVAQVQDFFSGDQVNQEGYAGDGDFGGDDDFGGDGENGSVGADGDHSADSGMVGQGRGTFVPFDPARGPSERDLIMAMMDPDADGGTMNYFDKNVMKNWAGPEHWKLRKAIRKREFLLRFLSRTYRDTDDPPCFLLSVF
jgi:condensin complex subunit 2